MWADLLCHECKLWVIFNYFIATVDKILYAIFYPYNLMCNNLIKFNVFKYI